jgi:alpha-2-macroglobulin
MRLGKRAIALCWFCVGLVMALFFAGCNPASITPKATQPLATVAEISPPPKLPDWIEAISPIGNTKPLAQIRVRFKEPLIPVESLENENQQQLLQKFQLTPELKGQFRFLTPRMVGFQADEAIPQATRVRVTLKAGLADLKNHKLDQDLAWTLQTTAVKLTQLPTSYTDGNLKATAPFEQQPKLSLTSNVPLDQNSLKEHAKLLPDGKTNGVALNVSLEKQPQTNRADTAEENFDASLQEWVYTLEPERKLDLATIYNLDITPGLQGENGNLPSTESFKSRIATYSPLAFDRLKLDTTNPGRFDNGVPTLEFNNALDSESIEKSISISPEPARKDIKWVRGYEGDRVLSLNPWALAPATDYKITMSDRLKDKFGQTLSNASTISYRTGDAIPDLWAPEDLHIFPVAGGNKANPLQLDISTINLDGYRSAFAIVQPTDLVYTDSAYPSPDGSLLPKLETWKPTPVKTKKNETIYNSVPLQKLLNGATGMVAYGVEKTNSSNTSHYGLVQLTNLGVFAEFFPDSGLVRVHRLSDGAAVPNATVQIYRSKLAEKERPQPTPCATGKTDKAGLLALENAQFQACRAARSETASALLTIAQVGNDWAFTRTREYDGAYGYGVDAGWETGEPESRGTIFSDRQLYQPGETAYFTGAAYYLQAGKLKQDKNVAYALKLQSPDGKTKDLGKQTTNAFGTFSVEVPIATNQTLGTYTLRAKGDSGAEISGEFRVAEFKPPNFKVELGLSGGEKAEGRGQKAEGRRGFGAAEKAPEIFAVPDNKIEAKVQGKYLFGAPVQGGEVEYYVTRQQTQFTPQGWDRFSFGQRWFWPQEAPEVSSDVLQTKQTLSATGESQETVTIANDLPYPMIYRIDAQVKDVSNLAVSDSQEVLALPSDRLIGLKTDYVANAGKEFPVQVIVTDPTGKPLTNQKIRLELQEMKYSAITRVVEGSDTAQNQVEYKTVADLEVQSGQEAQIVQLTAPNSGSYRIRALLDDGKEASATDEQIWVSGNEATFWGDRYTNNRLELKLDKATYTPGETATALIQSPYPEAELYFAVVRHDTIFQTVTKVSGSAPRITFTVTPDMVPNAAIQAVLIRQGKPLEQTEPGSLDKLTRIGFVPFNTSLDEHYLQVEVNPAIGKEGGTPASPGAEQSVELTLKDPQGNPVKGQFTVMAVNEAVLQLSGYRPPDLVKLVFAEQPISLRFSDNRPDVVLQPIGSPLQKGWGYGGGLSQGAENTRTRTDFKPIAFYNGAVATDTSGKAKVSFKLPDDLTTWRVMAVGMDDSFNFGNGDTTFVTSKPVMSNPILPQFARPGDRFQIGASVTNNTGQKGDLTLDGTVSSPLKLEKEAKQTTSLEPGTNAYRFPVIVEQPGEAKIKFSSRLNANDDAFEVPLDVKPLEITEQVVETGLTTNQVTIPLNIEQNVSNEAGGLDVSLSSSLIPQLVAPAQQTLDEDDLSFLETAASQLWVASSLQTLSQTYGQTFGAFNPQAQATKALAKLPPLQKPDGGFASYPTAEKSDPFVTAYAAQAIAAAQQAFGDSLGATRSFPALQGYLSKVLANPAQFDFCKKALCQAQLRLETLLALADLGSKRSDFLAEIYAQRDQLDPVQQMKLARYSAQFPDWQAEAKTLAAQFQQTTYETGRSARINLPQGWRWFGSGTLTQSEALRLAIAQSAKAETQGKLVQGLLDQRRNGTWQTTCDNAAALAALVLYSKQQPTPPNFSATATLAGKTLASPTFAGYKKPSETAKTAMTDLPRGKNNLELKKSGNGNLHYLVAYRYRLQGDQPGRLNGLRVTRTIRPANQTDILHTTGLSVPEALKVPAGQVYDVGLEIIADRPVDQVVITDPLPAGFEAVDNSFQTSTPYFKARSDSWQVNYQTIHRDRIVAFADKFNPGVYSLHYLVRSVTPGTFTYPGAEAHLQYAPEEFGRTASTTLTVEER